MEIVFNKELNQKYEYGNKPVLEDHDRCTFNGSERHTMTMSTMLSK